ncbi:hypothetical protein HYT52_04945 [Candidatus Woesearchaeota archaeon]|nr:hypothetical protein [Candidatus Woesearchaeota archaeon]
MGKPIPWDKNIQQRVEERLLNGDRIKDIAQEEGLTLKQLSSEFFRRLGQYPRAWAMERNPDLLKRHKLSSSRALDVNEHYFDNFLENPTEHVAYVTGLLYGRPVISQKGDFSFCSKNETLVDIVRTELEARHKPVVTGNTGAYELHFYSVIHLYQTLHTLGFSRPARERQFLDLPDSMMSHFIRGIVDGNAGVQQTRDTDVRIGFFRFGLPFLAAMHSYLKEQAGVRGQGPSGQRFSYRGANANRVRDFIYQDAAYLEDTGLFLPETKRILEDGKEPATAAAPPEDFGPIERMLLSGARVQEVAASYGYHVDTFRRIFNRQYGVSPTNWVKENKSS